MLTEEKNRSISKPLTIVRIADRMTLTQEAQSLMIITAPDQSNVVAVKKNGQTSTGS
jgi:hypothetical protein